MAFILLLSLVILIFSIRKVKGNSLYFLPIFYMVIVSYTIIGTQIFNFAKDAPFDFYDIIDTEDLRVYLYFILASILFIFGMATVKSERLKIENNLRYVKSISVKNSYIILLYIFLVVVFHVGHGFGNVYYREGYLLSGGGVPQLRIIYTIFLPFTCLLLPFFKNRFVRYVMLLMLVILIQGTSSRNLVIIPSCYYLGCFLRDNNLSLIRLIITLFFVLLFSAFAIEYRDNIYQGVIPNLLKFINDGVDVEYLIKAINYLASFSIFSSALVIQEHAVDLKSLLISISPLPSGFLDVDFMIENQKINRFAPFPAISTLAVVGLSIFIPYYFLSGVIWKLIYFRLTKGNIYLKFFILILFILYVVLSTQYNLRSVTRIIYYAVFFGVFYSFLGYFKSILRKYL